MTNDACERIEFLDPVELAPPPGYSNVATIQRGRIAYIAGQVATDGQGNLVGGDDFRA